MKRGPQRGPLFILTAGVEPTTRCLEGSCSIQLSYASKSGSNIAKSFKLFNRTKASSSLLFSGKVLVLDAAGAIAVISIRLRKESIAFNKTHVHPSVAFAYRRTPECGPVTKVHINRFVAD